jgi:putative transposase
MMPPSADDRPDDWIGVDLNTTGHLAVVAHPASGGVVMLGKRPERVEMGRTDPHRRYSSTTNYKKVRRRRKRERNTQGDQNQKVAKEIVTMARNLWCGIKLEDLTGAGFAGRDKPGTSLFFSRHEGSFYHLQKMIEARAESAGVQVVYVDPAFTSQDCSRCGEPGTRRGKEFFCPECGYAAGADANAAFNIAAAPSCRV